MGGNGRLALGFLMLWIAGVALFAAFHPGGIKNGDKPAQNPADVLRYLMTKLAGGGESSGSNEPSASGTETT